MIYIYIILSIISFYFCNCVIRNEINKDEDIGMVYKKYQLFISAIFAIIILVDTKVLNPKVFISISMLNILIILLVIYSSKILNNNIYKINRLFCFVCSGLPIAAIIF